MPRSPLGMLFGGPTKLWADPHFTADTAPALLGFDENIDQYCEQHGHRWQEGHAEKCVSANVNILSLYGDEVPYNMCRNIEWLTCAINGLLPGQGGPSVRGGDTLRFAKAPRNLEPSSGDRPIGACFGYHPEGCGVTGCAAVRLKLARGSRRLSLRAHPRHVEVVTAPDASSDIFYMEACFFNQVCSNAQDLWNLADGQDWRCQFNEQGLRQLTVWLRPRFNYFE